VGSFSSLHPSRLRPLVTPLVLTNVKAEKIRRVEIFCIKIHLAGVWEKSPSAAGGNIEGWKRIHRCCGDFTAFLIKEYAFLGKFCYKFLLKNEFLNGRIKCVDALQSFAPWRVPPFAFPYYTK